MPLDAPDASHSSDLDATAQGMQILSSTDPAGDLVSAAAERAGLPAEARAYLRAARADSTRRGYATDLNELLIWCADVGRSSWPITPELVRDHIVTIAVAGASVGTISRRLSSIRTLHRLGGLTDPTEDPLLEEVWRGIRAEHGRAPEQARPLMPPALWEVVAACPTATDTGQVRLAGVRDRALLLLGFTGALRRSELAAARVCDLEDHENGMILKIPRSKTDREGRGDVVVLPRAPIPEHCPVTALMAWLEAAQLSRADAGPLLRPVSKANRALNRHLSPASVNVLVQEAAERAGLDTERISAHSLRAGFVTHAFRRGASDRAIAKQTRHRSLDSVDDYVRLEKAWQENAATDLW